MRAGRLARLARRLGLDRNPLRRRVDRVERLIMAGLVAVFLISAPASWIAVGRWVQQGGLREQRAQRSWHPVPAVVVDGVRDLPPYMIRLPVSATARVLARWPGSGGREQTGEITVPATESATGTSLQLWVNHVGQVTGPPLVGSALAKRVHGAQALAEVILVTLLLGLAALARWWANRMRLARWAAEWAAIGPRWTRRR